MIAANEIRQMRLRSKGSLAGLRKRYCEQVEIDIARCDPPRYWFSAGDQAAQADGGAFDRSMRSFFTMCLTFIINYVT